MRSAGYVAKVSLLSSFLTLVMVIGVLYVFRGEIALYILSAAERTAAPVVVETIETKEPIVEAVAKVNPAVVSVIATKDVPIFERYYETIQPFGFFGGFTIPRLRENGFEEQEVGGGSGFIVTTDGYVITNNHVVADQEARYSVVLNDGRSFPISVLATDPGIDIAVAKIDTDETQTFPSAVFGDSTSLELGQTVIAIGNVLAEFQNSVSAGVISGLSRSIVARDATGQSEELHQIIQTDAAINPGNSGGPLLNLAGEVVGVNVATSQGADNIGFAIPAELVSHTLSSVLEFGEIVRPFLGVRYLAVNDTIAEANNLPVDYGFLVVGNDSPEVPAVLPGSPAEAAGIIENDVIIAMGGISLRNTDLGTFLRTKPIGVPLSVELVRNGEVILLEVVLTRN